MQPEPIGSLEGWVERVKALSKSTQALKERSLYVYYRRRKILLPSQVTEKAAHKRIEAVREALDFADRAFCGESVTIMFTQLNALAGQLKNSMVVDPDATAAALQEAIRGGSQQNIQSLVNEHATIADEQKWGHCCV